MTRGMLAYGCLRRRGSESVTICVHREPEAVTHTELGEDRCEMVANGMPLNIRTAPSALAAPSTRPDDVFTCAAADVVIPIA
jgi:hypothetical protein